MSSSKNTEPSASDDGLKIWSCVICRRRKVRCDRKDPCSNCVKNNIECHFPVTGRIPRTRRDPSASKSPAQKQSELLGRLRRLESVVTELAAQVEDGSQGPGGTVASSGPGRGSIASSEAGQTSMDTSVTESSQTVSSTSNHAGSEFDEEFGRLVVDKGGTLHVGNRFWSVFCGEVDNILQAVHDVAEYSGPSNSIMPESGLEGAPSPLSHLGFVFGNADFAKALDGLNPMPSQMLFIWQTYVENVDPFIKVLHVPTVEKVVRELRGNFSTYGPNMEALLFAVSLAAITSMDEEAVMFNFNAPKPQLLQRYQFGTEQALARADFLVTKDIVVLQALVIYISLLPHLDAKEKVWPMMGLVLRLAKGIGLDRSDGNQQTPLERETRRRLWWQICLVDSLSRRPEAPDVSIAQGSFETPLPTNVDDRDLLDDMVAPLLPPQERTTDTTLLLIRCELWRLTQSLRADATKSPEALLELLYSSKAKVETIYLRHLQLSKSWDRFISTMATLFFAEVELFLRQPRVSHTTQTPLEPAINIIKAVYSLKSDPSWSKWRWQLQGQVPWHALGVFLRHACRQPWMSQLNEAWNAAQAIISTAPENVKTGSLWHSLMQLYKGAQAQRQAAESQLEQPPPDNPAFNASQGVNATTILSETNQMNPVIIDSSAFNSSLHISPPGPGNPPTEHQGLELHAAFNNPTLLSPAGGLPDFGENQTLGDVSVLDDADLMDWDALIDVDNTLATWDFF
ncbi:hypothetical protein FDECE_10285 [Fusarium decemcellulare]|nr:hypothetical protein FDECE_10285 [Fusarium decemcellulare]